MIGYDRPLKPEWIYKTLKLVEPGKKPEDYYDAYNEIAVEYRLILRVKRFSQLRMRFYFMLK